MEHLKVSMSVIVAPSMSGTFALTLLFHEPQLFIWYFGLAAVIGEVSPEVLRQVKVPTLLVHGQRDHMGQRSSSVYSGIPGSQVREIPDGEHACYLTNPALWHDMLTTFLKKLERATAA
jgi:abhydrolase domain-containing protein 14